MDKTCDEICIELKVSTKYIRSIVNEIIAEIQSMKDSAMRKDKIANKVKSNG